MKTHINLRSTSGNSSWIQRGAAALAAIIVTAVAGITLMHTLRPGTQALPGALAPRVAVPSERSRHLPALGSGSAYDGGVYVRAFPAGRAASNMPVAGASSAYDGGAYAAVRRTSRNVPVTGTSSAYDGGVHGIAQHVSRNAP